jgi:hypothetical protein
MATSGIEMTGKRFPIFPDAFRRQDVGDFRQPQFERALTYDTIGSAY